VAAGLGFGFGHGGARDASAAASGGRMEWFRLNAVISSGDGN
jgi:hypothetical protein